MGMTTAVTPNTFSKLQLNAGVLLTNFTYSTAKDATALAALVKTAIEGTGCLGATRGGGTFTATPSTREIEADGKRYGFKGSTIVDSWDIKLTGTILEVTPDNIVKALGSGTSTVDTGNKMTTIKLNTNYGADDYLTNVCWVGDTSDGGLVLICLKNALNTTGLSFTFSDKAEGTIPFEFHAYQQNVSELETAPVEIVFFTK